MKILITGSQGQLGRALAATLASKHELILLGRDALDISDAGAVEAALDGGKPELVMNAAAYTRVDAAESAPEAAARVNTLGAQNLAAATFAKRIPILHISTDYVFDGTLGRPYHEEDEPHPLSVYGLSKWHGEQAVRAATPLHYIVRTAWLYSASSGNFLWTMLDLARQKREVRVVNDQWGSPTYAPDLAFAIASLIETGAYGTYHLAGDGQTTWWEWTRFLYDLLGVSVPILPIESATLNRPARRPVFSALTSIRTPRIWLPSWRQGTQNFVQSLPPTTPS